MSRHNFGPLIALLVLFSLPIIESRSSRGSSHAATKSQMSHREETWMDMMQATQSQQCNSLAICNDSNQHTPQRFRLPSDGFISEVCAMNAGEAHVPQGYVLKTDAGHDAWRKRIKGK